MEFEIYVNDELIMVKEYPNTMTPFTIIKSVINNIKKNNILADGEKVANYYFNGNKLVLKTCQQY